MRFEAALEREKKRPRDNVREALKRGLEAARYAADRPFDNTMPPTQPILWLRQNRSSVAVVR